MRVSDFLDICNSVLAIGTEKGSIFIRNVIEPEKDCIPKIQAHENMILGLSFNYSGKILASSSDDASVKLWDVQTGKCLKTIQGYIKRYKSNCI